MFSRIIAYSLHSLIVIACVISVVILIPQLWMPICIISIVISTSFKRRCWGFYYNNREKIDVEFVEVGPRRMKGQT